MEELIIGTPLIVSRLNERVESFLFEDEASAVSTVLIREVIAFSVLVFSRSGTPSLNVARTKSPANSKSSGCIRPLRFINQNIPTGY